jgi:hypothetical protein
MFLRNVGLSSDYTALQPEDLAVCFAFYYWVIDLTLPVHDINSTVIVGLKVQCVTKVMVGF